MTAAPKFTAGPWVRGSCDDLTVWAARFNSTAWKRDQSHVGAEGVAIADVEAPAWIGVQCDEATRDAWLAESGANAALIAAAPDLYEALEFIFDHIADKERGPSDLYSAFGLDSRRAIEMARAALAKARYEP